MEINASHFNTRRAVIVLLSALAIWHLTLRRYGFFLPMMSDEGEYAYQAQVIERGGTPYLDAYNQKPPLIFYLYRSAEKLFGQSPWAPRMLAVFFSWATMLLLWLLTPKTWDWRARAIAPAAFAVMSTEPIGDLGFSANTEIFLCAFTALCAWSMMKARGIPRDRRWPLLAGLSAGAALMTKQTAFWSLVAFGGLVVWMSSGRLKDILRRLGLYVGGVALIPALFLVYFWRRGAAGAFIEETFLRNLSYASVVWLSSDAGTQVRWVFGAVIPKLLKGDWILVALALAGIANAANFGFVAALSAAWLAASLIGVATGLFFFPHYFLQCYPPLAVLAAVGANVVDRKVGSRANALTWLLAAVLIYPAAARAQIYFWDSPQAVAKKLLYPNPLYESMAIGDFIRDHSSANDSIYVFGSEPQIYVYSGRRAATRHDFVYPLTLFPKDFPQVRRELLAIEQAKPKFIVFVNQSASTLIGTRIGESFRAGLIGLLSRGYRWIGTVDVRPDASRVAFWNDEPASASMPDWAAQDKIYLFEVSAP